MIRTSIRLFAAAAAALALVTSLHPHAGMAAQAQSGGFSLPPPSPTPTRAPEGPADERAGVVIPPRNRPVAIPTPTPNPATAPTAAPTAAPTPLAIPAPTRAPTPAPRPAAGPSAGTASRPVSTPLPGPQTSPAPAAGSASASPAPAQAPVLPPETAGADSPPLTLPNAAGDAAPRAPAADRAADAAMPLALPDWWPWAAGGLAGLAVLAAALMLRRRRAPRVLRLAPPPPGMADAASVPALPRLDLALEVTGATRSVMMFTIAYRLTLANRTDHAVSGLGIAVQLVCARREASNAAAPGAAQVLDLVDRIGPHQSRSISGEVQLPLAAIAPLRQGNQPLFIPLVHVTLEGEGQQALTRSFVVGAPSTASAARLHPIRLDTPPGSIPGLRAQMVDVPPVSAAA